MTMTEQQREAEKRDLIKGRHGIVAQVGLQVRDAQTAAGSRRIEGMAVPYNTEIDLGWYYEQFAPGAFTKSIREAARALPLLLFHNDRDLGSVIGVNESWDERSDGLHGVWRFDETDDAKAAIERVESGSLAFMSIGFQPVAGEQGSVISWDDMDELHVLRKEARLVEVSLVATPAYKDAAITKVRAARPVQSTRRLEAARAWLAANRV